MTQSQQEPNTDSFNWPSEIEPPAPSPDNVISMPDVLNNAVKLTAEHAHTLGITQPSDMIALLDTVLAFLDPCRVIPAMRAASGMGDSCSGCPICEGENTE